MSDAPGRVVFVFPGQGSQKPGMGRDFYERWTTARAAFEEASQACGLDMARLCFDDDERLGRTEFQQPAILTVEIAMARVLAGELGLAPDLLGGHSLGEYAALTAAGVLELGQAVRLVRERGRLMQEAAPAGDGAMAAVIRAELDIEALAGELAGIEVDIANHNGADQAVVSGRSQDVEAAARALRESATRTRVIPLRVSAAFHSRWMRPARDAFAPLLQQASADWSASRAAVVASNTDGGLHRGEAADLVASLTEQITAPVRWVDNMRVLTSTPARVVELGPGRPLRGFFASIGLRIESVSTAEAAMALV